MINEVNEEAGFGAVGKKFFSAVGFLGFLE